MTQLKYNISFKVSILVFSNCDTWNVFMLISLRTCTKTIIIQRWDSFRFINLCFLLIFSWVRVSLCSAGWPSTRSGPPECWMLGLQSCHHAGPARRHCFHTPLQAQSHGAKALATEKTNQKKHCHWQILENSANLSARETSYKFLLQTLKFHRYLISGQTAFWSVQ